MSVKNDSGNIPKETSPPAEKKWERYSPKDAEYFRQIIIQKRETILRQLGLLTEATRSASQEIMNDNSTYSLHMADQGTDAQEREKLFLLASREGRYLKYLERALRMIDEGTYGICTDCGQPIEKRRLEVVPTARLCIACKQKEEQRRGG
ncbi:MAG: TraR/DksA family transcriptional regulator [bacterium]